MKSKEKLIKERDQLRLKIRDLRVEYETLKPGSREELSVGKALALLRINLCKLQKEIA